MTSVYSDKIVFWRSFLINALILITTALVVYLVDFVNPAPAVLRDYRFHRDLYAFISGFILGFAGSVLQASLRNPLVDHYVLGVGSTSLFAAYLTIAVTGVVDSTRIAISSLAGGLSGLLLSISIANLLGGGEVSYILSGIGVASVFSGASFLLSYYILEKQPYAQALLLGSFATPSKEYMPYLVAATAAVILSYILLAKRLNVLLLGDIYSRQLGVEPSLTRLVSTLIAGSVASVVVGFFGTIGFVGLITPNLTRLLTKTSDNRVVIMYSSVTSGALLLATDLLARKALVASVGEVPAGGVVSALGGLFFLGLLIREVRGSR